MAVDELVPWLRAEITQDRDSAAAKLRRSRMSAGYRRHLMEAAARAEAELAVLGLYERQAAREFDNAMEEDRTWVLAPVVRLLGHGYRLRAGYQEAAWKP